AIFSSLGSNLTLKDKKLNIQAFKPYLMIKEALAAVRAEQEMFEPAKYGSIPREKVAFAASSPSWLPGRDSNPDTQDQNLMSYH
ncbi:MAG: hypothetical protein Greene101415_248, partial [Parcubacteria group bacterium Greene1014_15]